MATGAIKVASRFNMVLTAGKATPQPPVGSALGQRGLNLMNFCKAFNDETAKYKEVPIRVRCGPLARVCAARVAHTTVCDAVAGARHGLHGPHLHI